MAARYLLPALAAAGRAAAATCSAATTTIQNQGDASALASCQTFTGTIAIATGVTGNIALDGIERIEGSLIADGAKSMTELSGDSLTIIDDTFNLNGLIIMASLNFPLLSNVDTIDWIALPALQGLTFGTPGVQQTTSLSIQNTFLSTLDGIDLMTVDTVLIANNNFLDDISMQLGNVTTSLIIEANGQNVSANFPNMEWAFNMTLRNVSSISIPSLASVNGSMGFISNFISDFSAPNLTSVGQTLTFMDNGELTNISMPELKTVGGGLTLTNNTGVSSYSFPNLATVGGAVSIDGAYTQVQLPDVTDVRGAFNLTSTKDISSSCSHFQSEAGANDVIKGTFTCNSASSGGSSSGGSSTSSGGSSSSSSSSANAVVITGATGVLGVVAAIFGML